MPADWRRRSSSIRPSRSSSRTRSTSSPMRRAGWVGSMPNWPSWSMAPVVAAYQALRGFSFIVAVTFVSEIGDVRHFDTPRQLMAFLGLVPSERSTGDTVKRGGLTLAGNRRARRVLVEGAWSYRHPARVTEPIRVRLEELPKAMREIAWKAQTRLCARYRRMRTAGKKKPIVVAAIAREMAAFLWAIGHQVEPVR